MSSCQYIPSDVQKVGVPLIHGERISCVFEGKTEVIAVDDVSFGIEENSITAIIGSSGSGKSTLLKLIYGLLEPNEGEIRYRGWLVPTRKDKLIPGHDAMRIVSQGFDDLNLYAKVWDNVASQLSNTDLDHKKRRTEEALQMLQIDHLAQKRIADLSGGEKQRVAIARALVNDPEVLLMDEPFNQVDAAFREALQQTIRHIVRSTALTIVLVSHDPAEVLALSDDLIVMREGKIIEAGKPTDLYITPRHSYTARLLAKSNILQPEDAAVFEIHSDNPIGVRQENVRLTADTDASFYIHDILFRGLYREVVVTDGTITLHAISPLPQQVSVGDPVSVHIATFNRFESEGKE